MRRGVVVAVHVLALVLAIAGASAGTAARGPVKKPAKLESVAGELVVKFRAGVSQDGRRSALAAAGADEKRALGRGHGLRLAKTSPERLQLALKRLEKDPRVEYAEPNYRLEALGMPNDPSLAQLWGLVNTGQTVNGVSGTADADIDAEIAWNVATGSAGVVVAVIDTGVDFGHRDLGGSQTGSPVMWTNAGEVGSGRESNGIDDDGNGYVDDWRGWDFVNGDNDPFDDNGHGTHVSGTIGALGNDGAGIAGVNWRTRIMPLKFLDATGGGSLADAVAAISYATRMGAAVTNNSWGGGPYSQALADVIAEADAAGSLFVAAAGNDGLDNDAFPSYPASYELPNVISVAATDQDDGRPDWSNYGQGSVDLGAPGANIYSTIPGGGYDWWDGTSMATPHVAGTAALAKAAFPSATAVGLKALLLDTVDGTAALSSATASGGRLNAGRALTCASWPSVWIDAPAPGFRAPVGATVPVRVIGASCGSAGASVTATVNGAQVALSSRGDGLYTGSVEASAAGPVTVTATAALGSATDTRSVTGSVYQTYRRADVPFEWVDATVGGTRLSLGDDAGAAVTLPFSFTYFGTQYSSLKVSSNGFLVFGTSAATEHRNKPIPSSAVPNGVVAALWDDLDPSAGGSIWHRTLGTAPNRRFVVAWVNVPGFASYTLDGGSFEVILEESSGDLVFQYKDVSFGDTAWSDYGASATIGVERADGLVGAPFSHDEAVLGQYESAKGVRWSYGNAPDTTPPTVSVTAPAEGALLRGTVTLEASAADNVGVARVELLAGGSVVATVGAPPYAASWSSTSVADGTVEITARAVDAAGNIGTAAARLITVDNTPPRATITSGPAPSTSALSASFAFSASETGARFECSLNAAAFAACVSPQAYSALAVGEHVFQVRAADPAGNVQQPPSEHRWTIVAADTVAPETTIDSGPSGTVTSTSASLAFSASEPNVTFACRLDASAWVSCTSPQSYAALAAGEHTFEVRATDASGNADPTPASRSWSVQSADTTPPETVVESGPASSTTGTSATFTFSSSEPGSSFACALDQATPSACTSPVSYTGLAAGPHRLRVHSTDRSGNIDPTPAEWSWAIVLAPLDTTAPQTTIDGGPSGTTTALSASFAFSANETDARFECSVDGGAWASCTSPHALANLALGPHTFAVRAIDTAGNVDAAPAVREWTVGTQPATEPAPAPALPSPPPSGSGGGDGGAGADAPQPSASPAAPAVGSANDSVTVTTVVASAQPPQPALQAPKAPVVRLLTPARLRIPPRGPTATLALRFSVSEAVRLRVAVTPLRSGPALPLLRGTLLGGTRSAQTKTAATATVTRGGAYAFVGRLTAARLVKGRTYLVRVTATDAGGHQRLLTLRVRA